MWFLTVCINIVGKNYGFMGRNFGLMRIQEKSYINILIIILILFLSNELSALSFPFRSIKVGDQIKELLLKPFKGDTTVTLNDLKDKNVVIAFWGADLPVKRQRSERLIKELLDLEDFFKENNIAFYTVDAQNDEPSDMEEVIKGVGREFPVYLDGTGKLYGELGIFVVPAVLILDKEHKVVNGFGYSSDLVDRVRGELEIMLGKKTREEVERELNPVNVEKTPKEKEAIRYYNMGQVLAKRGMNEEAIKNIKKALELDPKMGEAWAELGCLNVELGRTKEAEEALDHAFDLVPDSVKATICDAKLRAQTGEIEDAIEDLRGLVLKNARNIDLHYTLGWLYEKNKNMEEAAKEYKTAFELLKETTSHFGGE